MGNKGGVIEPGIAHRFILKAQNVLFRDTLASVYQPQWPRRRSGTRSDHTYHVQQKGRVARLFAG